MFRLNSYQRHRVKVEVRGAKTCLLYPGRGGLPLTEDSIVFIFFAHPPRVGPGKVSK